MRSHISMKKHSTQHNLDYINDKKSHRKLLNVNNDYNNNSSGEEDSINFNNGDNIELSNTSPSKTQRLEKDSSTTSLSDFNEQEPTTPTQEIKSRLRSKSRPKASTITPKHKKNLSSSSNLTLDSLVEHVSRNENGRLNNKKRVDRKFPNSKYISRFNDITFQSYSSTIFDSDEFMTSQFYGIYVLFWLATAFVMFNNVVHIYFEGSVSFWEWKIVKLFQQDIIKIGMTDLVMYLSTYFAFFIQVLCQKDLITWTRTGWVIQSLFNFAFGVFWLLFASKYYMNYHWIAKVFLLLHSLVFIMKMHSYGFYNGYLWQVYHEGLFSQEYLLKLINKQVDLPDGFEFEATKRALIESVSFTKYELEYQTNATTDATPNSADLHKFEEDTKLKSFEELQDEGLINFPQNINLFNYFQYSMFPTLVYTLNFPRTNKIRWSFVATKTLGIFGIIFLMILIAENSFYPLVNRCEIVRKLPINERIPQYFFILLDMIPTFLAEYLFTFFLIWDAILNDLAELTYYADRNFYGPWWSCTDFSDFARLWNIPVHNFLLRHVYHSSISALKVNKIQAALMTFIISSIVHELAMYVIFNSFRGYLLLFQMSQIPLIMMSRSRFMRNKKVLGNIICWIGFISGPSIICTLYLIF